MFNSVFLKMNRANLIMITGVKKSLPLSCGLSLSPFFSLSLPHPSFTLPLYVHLLFAFSSLSFSSSRSFAPSPAFYSASASDFPSAIIIFITHQLCVFDYVWLKGEFGSERERGVSLESRACLIT